MKISLFEVSFFPTFFGAILGPIWLPFSGSKIFIFFTKINKNRRDQKRTPPSYKAFSSQHAPDPQNVPKRYPKWSQNAFQNDPKRLQKLLSSVPLRAFAVLASGALRKKHLSHDKHALYEEHLFMINRQCVRNSHIWFLWKNFSAVLLVTSFHSFKR